MCSKAHPWVKTLFAQSGGLVPPPLNDMEVLAHILNGRIEDVAIKINGRRICSDISNGRGLKFHPLTNNLEDPNISTNKIT
jgi:hypothetical protein